MINESNDCVQNIHMSIINEPFAKMNTMFDQIYHHFMTATSMLNMVISVN